MIWDFGQNGNLYNQPKWGFGEESWFNQKLGTALTQLLGNWAKCTKCIWRSPKSWGYPKIQSSWMTMTWYWNPWWRLGIPASATDALQIGRSRSHWWPLESKLNVTLIIWHGDVKTVDVCVSAGYENINPEKPWKQKKHEETLHLPTKKYQKQTWPFLPFPFLDYWRNLHHDLAPPEKMSRETSKQSL